MYLALTQTLAFVGKAILAHCAGSSALCLSQIDLFQHRHRLAFGKVGNDFALETGLAANIDALAPTSAGPGTSATGGSAMVASLAAASLRFLCGTTFFLAGAFVTAGAGSAVVAAGAVIAAAGVAVGGVISGAFVCASRLVDIVATKTDQICFFIIQPSKVLISVSVNVRQRPGFSSPSLILPICVRCNRFTVRPCDSNSRRTSRFLPSPSSSSTTLLRATGRNQPRRLRLEFFARVQMPRVNRREHRLVHLAFDGRHVFFADAVTRMRQAQGELSIIGQKNQSFSVEIQTAHGMQILPFLWQ